MKALALLLGTTLALSPPALGSPEESGRGATPALDLTSEAPGAPPSEGPDEDADRWATLTVVSVVVLAVVAVATGAVVSTWRPPCDASLGCTQPP